MIENLTITKLTDDLDGTQDPTVATRAFSVGGDYRLIELSDANFTTLIGVIAPFMAKSRPVGAPSRAGKRKGVPRPGLSQSERDLNREIREWAKSAGKNIKPKGRITPELRREYMGAIANHAVTPQTPPPGEPAFSDGVPQF